jgi:2-methylisocitrate lyase-like PEP mutase family enzyme
MSTSTPGERRQRFRAMHGHGTFVMPNAWDIGSARLLAAMGFEALATTSLGHAAALGKSDQSVTRAELLVHVEALASAVDLPLSVDAERCFADEPAGVAATVHLLAEAGAAGCSIEDYDPDREAIDPLDVAIERVTAAAEAARVHDMVLTARAENFLYGIDDLDDTITRLIAYRDAGAEVVYAPRMARADDIRRLVEAVQAPVNVLAIRDGPPIGDLASFDAPRVDRWLAGSGRLRRADRRRPRATDRRNLDLPRRGGRHSRPGRHALGGQPRLRREDEVQEGEHIGALVDQLADRLADAMPGVGVDPRQDRRVGRLGGLERRRELERMPRHDPVVVIAGRDQRRRIRGPGPDAVERRVGEEGAERVGIVGRAVVARPSPADREAVEAQHVHDAHLGDRRAHQLRMLRDGGTHQQATVRSAADADAVGARPA